MAVHQRFNVGLDTGQFDRGAQRLIDVSGRTAREVAANWNRVNRGEGIARSLNGGRGGNGSGGVAVQIQDIAVQLQSGTKLATIMAQQGSQLASVFGPQGAIVGGMIAVIAFLHTISRGTAKLVQDAIDLGRAIDKSAFSFSGLADNTEKAQKNIKALTDDLSTKQGKSGMLANIGDAIVGGYGVLTGQGTKKEKEASAARAVLIAQQNIVRAQQMSINLADRELGLAQEEAKGDQEKISRLRDEQAYEERIAEIKNSTFDADTKAALRDLADKRLAAQEDGRTRIREEKASKDRKERQKEINVEYKKAQDLKNQTRDFNSTDEQRLAQLKVNLDSAKHGSSKDPLVVAQAAAKAAGIELEITKLSAKIKEETARSFAKQNAEQMKDFEKYVEKQKQLAELNADLGDAARASGRARRYREGQKILDRADEILTPAAERADARRAARRRSRAERRAAEEQVNREDKQNRDIGVGITGLTRKERKARIADLIRKAEEAKRKDKIEATFKPDQIQVIVKAIAELQAK